MDFYLVTRMFRSFNVYNSNFILIYVGEAHAERYRRLFQRLNFHLVNQTFAYNDTNRGKVSCLDISSFTNKIFFKDPLSLQIVKKLQQEKDEKQYRRSLQQFYSETNKGRNCPCISKCNLYNVSNLPSWCYVDSSCKYAHTGLFGKKYKFCLPTLQSDK